MLSRFAQPVGGNFFTEFPLDRAFLYAFPGWGRVICFLIGSRWISLRFVNLHVSFSGGRNSFYLPSFPSCAVPGPTCYSTQLVRTPVLLSWEGIFVVPFGRSHAFRWRMLPQGIHNKKSFPSVMTSPTRPCWCGPPFFPTVLSVILVAPPVWVVKCGSYISLSLFAGFYLCQFSSASVPVLDGWLTVRIPIVTQWLGS